MWPIELRRPTSRPPEKAKAGRHSPPGPRSAEPISRILDPTGFLRRLGSHFSSPPCSGLRRPPKRPAVRLQPGDVPLARNGRITRLPCSALHPSGFIPSPVTRRRGGLLPHRFTLTLLRQSYAGRSIFCDTVRRSWVTPKPPPVSQGKVSFGVRTFLPQTRFQVWERLPRFLKNLTTLWRQ
jgi:hypothetical protein